jgi:hypothetical protein
VSGALPTTPKFSALTFRTKNFNLKTESVSGRVQVRGIGGQRFEFTAVYPPMSRADFAPVYAFIMQQRGMLETFTVTPTKISASTGAASGTVTTSGSTASGATSATITGLTGTLKAGDFIKFATHSKVYMITADRAGNGALTFEPPLTVTVAGSTAITYNAVPITVRLNGDVQEYSLASDDHLVRYELDLIEAV